MKLNLLLIQLLLYFLLDEMPNRKQFLRCRISRLVSSWFEKNSEILVFGDHDLTLRLSLSFLFNTALISVRKNTCIHVRLINAVWEKSSSSTRFTSTEQRVKRGYHIILCKTKLSAESLHLAMIKYIHLFDSRINEQANINSIF